MSNLYFYDDLYTFPRPTLLVSGAIGTFSGVRFVTSPTVIKMVEPFLDQPKNAPYGPPKKGRGGKVKRW